MKKMLPIFLGVILLVTIGSVLLAPDVFLPASLRPTKAATTAQKPTAPGPNVPVTQAPDDTKVVIPKQAPQAAQAASAANATANTAPDMPVTNLISGNSTTLAALYQDKPLYLNIWASWCPPCVAEMPHIDALYKKYGDRMNFAAVSVDSSRGDALAYVKKAQLSLPCYYGNTNAIGRAYRVSAIPVSVLIAPGGQILNQRVGGMNQAALEAFLAPALP